MNWTIIVVVSIICITIDLVTDAITECIKNNDKLFWENYDKVMKYNNFSNIEEEEEIK